MHALLCQIIELQLAEKGLWGVERDALPLQVIQPKELLQHLLWCCKCEVRQPIALHHAPKGDDAPGALPEDKPGTIIDAEQVFRGAHRRDPSEAKLVCCIPLCMRDTVDHNQQWYEVWSPAYEPRWQAGSLIVQSKAHRESDCVALTGTVT